MITLCTMFDSAYHRKGLALIESLRRHVPDFALCVLALDSQVYDYFEQHKQRGVVVVSLREVETWELIEARHDRKWVEYIWTLTPHLTRFCFDLLDTDSVAYIDADCFLFNDLSQLYDEVGGASCAIIPHRWTPYQANRLRSAGIYNVSWVYFSRSGLHCLEDWREKCVEWCYWRVEADGRFADQGYLNDWPTRHEHPALASRPYVLHDALDFHHCRCDKRLGNYFIVYTHCGCNVNRRRSRTARWYWYSYIVLRIRHLFAL